MATELKSDAWHRYNMYRRDDASLRQFASEDELRRLVEAGKKFTGGAGAEIWAKDAGLVGRVRQFLGMSFHWHARLAVSGSNLDVIEMLQTMVRGGSVYVIPQELAHNSGPVRGDEEPRSSFWGADHYSHVLDVSLAQRYSAQLDAMNADGPTLADIRAMHDVINVEFMHAAVQADPLGTLPIFARAGWVSRYGLPDLSGYVADPTGEAESYCVDSTALPLDAQSFQYLSEQPDDRGIVDLAARGLSASDEAECDALYEVRMTYCSALSKMYGSDARTYLACKQRAFQDYQACRGY